MDEADRAQAAEERDRAIALQMTLARIPSKSPRTADDACTECGDPIEAERLRVLGATNHCASCAHQNARRARGYAWSR